MLPHMAPLMLLYMTPLILQLMLLLRKAHATQAACYSWRYSYCIAATQTPPKLPHMAPLMLLHMTAPILY